MFGRFGGLGGIGLGNIVNVQHIKGQAVSLGQVTAGALVAPMLYNKVFNSVASALKLQGAAVTYGKPIGGMLLGIIAADMISRKMPALSKVGYGIAAGLFITGSVQLIATAAPSVAKALDLNSTFTGAALQGYLRGLRGLRGAPVEVEEVNGAPISVESVGGLNGPSFVAALQ